MQVSPIWKEILFFRADLWALAGIVAVDEGIKNANNACESAKKACNCTDNNCKNANYACKSDDCTVPASGLVFQGGREVGEICSGSCRQVLSSFDPIVSHFGPSPFSTHHNCFEILLQIFIFLLAIFLLFFRYYPFVSVTSYHFVKDCPTSPYSTGEIALPTGNLNHTGVMDFFANGIPQKQLVMIWYDFDLCIKYLVSKSLALTRTRLLPWWELILLARW